MHSSVAGIFRDLVTGQDSQCVATYFSKFLFDCPNLGDIYICADSPWIALQNSKNQKVPLEQLAVMRAQIWAKILCCGLHGMFTSAF